MNRASLNGHNDAAGNDVAPTQSIPEAYIVSISVVESGGVRTVAYLFRI
jgi:hypothetical protein